MMIKLEAKPINLRKSSFSFTDTVVVDDLIVVLA